MSDRIKSLLETKALFTAFLFAIVSTLLLLLKMIKAYREVTSGGDTLGAHMTLASAQSIKGFGW